MQLSLFKAAFLAAAFVPMAGLAQESTSNQIFNQAPWNDDAMLELFAKAADDGRAYPTQAEFEAAGVTFDLEYVRSHTAKAKLIDAGHVVNHSTFNPERRLWMNLPGGFGSNTGGYPSARYNNDVYTMWNYTHLFGSWNYGFLLAPGSWVDAAHKNGTRIYSGIKFFESWTAGSQAAGFAKFITTKNPDGSFRYVDAIINACAFFGGDGLNYNMEDSAYLDEDWINFHAAVKKRAKERGLEDFGIGMYTANQSISAGNARALLGTAETGAVYDCFLNYMGGDFNARGAGASVTAAKNAVGSAKDVYQGVWIVTMDRNWTGMNASSAKEMNLVLWGEHDQSRFFQYAVGTNLMNIQENYQILLERSFTGGNRNPLNRPTLVDKNNNFSVRGADEFNIQMVNFGGLATMIPERSAIGGNLPFNTYFNIGNGDSYFYNGKITFGNWYNMGAQDYVPTWRWLLTPKGDMTKACSDPIDARFVHEESYIGGSSLRLTGKTSGADLHLYRTELKVSKGGVKATVALKGAKGATNTSLILRKKGSESWIEVPCGDLKANAWEKKEFNVAGLSEGDVVEYIGLRVNSSDENFKLYVGQIKLNDDFTATPANIKPGSLNIEIKEETPIRLTAKLNWQPEYAASALTDFGMVYNKDLNIDHYEIFYREGQDGKVKEIGRTSQWATVIGKIPMDQSTEAYLGVRSVSTDLKTVSGVEWVRIPRYTGTLPDVIDNSLYGETYLFNVGNSNKASIQKTIYWEDIKTEGATQNLNYHMDANPVTDSTQYYYAEDHKLIVAQGQEVTITLKGYEAGSDCLKYDWVRGYIDYDGNYSFNDADEQLFQAGTQNSATPSISTPGVTFKFTVPADAVTGPSRLRIVASDAWGTHPGPLGGTWKGYSIDFPLEITGTNPEREPAATYKDTADQGEADEPEGIFAGIGEVGTDNGYSTVVVADKVAQFTNTDKAWFYDVTGRCVKFVNNATESVSVADLAEGVYVVKMQSGVAIRSVKVVVK